MISLVIPCYNEARVIEKSVKSLTDFFSSRVEDFEIILIIEKSTDETLNLARKIGQKDSRVRIIENDRRYGKGYSVRRGILDSTGDYVFVIDADIPIDIDKYIPVMLMLVKEAGIGAVYATAISDKSDPQKRGLLRAAISFCLFAFRRWLLHQDISDSQLGCKIYNGSAIRQIVYYVQENNFLYELYITDLLTLLGYRIEECAVRIDRFSTESSVNSFTIIKSVVELINYLVKRRKLLKMGSSPNNKSVPLYKIPLIFLFFVMLFFSTFVVEKITAYSRDNYAVEIIEDDKQKDNVTYNVVESYGKKKTHPWKD